MRFNLKTLFLFAFAVSLFCANSFHCKAQTKQLTEGDKTELIQAILRLYNFEEGTVYLSSEQVSAGQVPERTDVNFVLIKPEEIKARARKKKGIKYYSFTFIQDGEPAGFKTELVIYFERIYDSSHVIQANTWAYECSKIEHKWDIKESEIKMSSIRGKKH